MRRMIRAGLRRARQVILGKQSESIYLADRYPDARIGRGSYGGLTVLTYDSPHKLTVGAYCSFAANTVVFLGGEHRPDWITTYPFNVLDPRFAAISGHPHSKGDVVIGNDVWVGRGAAILSGVRIGDGAVIGAYAIVARDVPDYAIVAGNPARLMRMRFSDTAIEKLKAIRWWEWHEDRIARAAPFLQSSRVEEFLHLVDKGEL